MLWYYTIVLFYIGDTDQYSRQDYFTPQWISIQHAAVDPGLPHALFIVLLLRGSAYRLC